jgi:hypothetical protein
VYIASGDSVPAGQDIDGQVENKEKAYPRWIRDYIGADVSLYPSTCTDLIGLGVYNIAEPGDTTTDYLTRQLSRIIGCDPDLVSITIGADDLLVVLGRNNPSPYTVKGRPLYVHLNGLAIVLLK